MQWYIFHLKNKQPSTKLWKRWAIRSELVTSHLHKALGAENRNKNSEFPKKGIKGSIARERWEKVGRFKGWADPLIGSEEARSGAFLAANTCPHYLQTLDSRELGFLSFLLFSFFYFPLYSFSIKYTNSKLSDYSSNGIERQKSLFFFTSVLNKHIHDTGYNNRFSLIHLHVSQIVR